MKKSWGAERKAANNRQQSSEPVFRGRKLVLNYTDGSPCDSSPKSRRSPSPKLIDDDDDDDDDKDRHSKKPKGSPDRHKTPHQPHAPKHRKSTLISLLCDKVAPKTTVAFVGASPDECAYFFEVRSAAACGGVSDARQSLGPGGVFGVM